MSYLQYILNNIPSVSKTENIEIELRCLIDSRLKFPRFIKNALNTEKTINYYKDLIKTICSPCHQTHVGNMATIIETIDFIHAVDNKNKLIKQLVFEKGVQVKDKLKMGSKENLIEPVFIQGQGSGFGFKLGINKEQELLKSQNINAFQYEKGRIKLRFSIWLDSQNNPIYKDLSDWRIDITLVKNIDKNTSVTMIKNIKDILFNPELSVENFAEKAAWDYADTIEMELEYMESKITESILGKAMDAILNIVKIDAYESNEDHQKILREISKLTYIRTSGGILSLKNVTPQVIELSKQSYFTAVQPNINALYLTDKADGIRSIIIIDPQIGYIKIVNNTVKTIPFLNKNNISGKCIADGELIESAENPKLYIFDVIMYDGKSVVNEPFSARLQYIEKFKKISKICYSKTFIKLTKEDFKTQIQEFYKKINISEDYENDGLIFTEDGKSYSKTASYKWKPLEKMTIDFLAKKCPKELKGIAPYNTRQDNTTLYLLFCGINNIQFNAFNMSYINYYKHMFPNVKHDYFPIQFSPSDNPYAYLFWDKNPDLDNQIIELTRRNQLEQDDWKLYRIREDRKSDVLTGKYYGNNYLIAETIWRNYQNPLTIEMLTEDAPKAYFQKRKTALHKVDRSYNRYVHSQLFDKYIKNTNIDWVIDLGSGKGQDLFRYAELGVKNILFIEKDKDALTELLSRKHKFSKMQKHGPNNTKRMSIYIQEMDLNDSWEKNIKRIRNAGIPIPISGVSCIFCGFAFHYFIENASKMINITKFIGTLLSSGGKFIYTAFNGKSVFDKLQSSNGRWTGYADDEKSIIKYDIKRKYKSNTFTGINQPIDVLLPFSMGEYYTEYLVNDELIGKYLKKMHIEHPSNDSYQSFSTYFKNFEIEKRNKKELILTPVDEEYLTLYYYSIYSKL